MKIDVRPASFLDIEPMRASYREEAGCQIIHDSILGRGLGDCYLIELDGELAGYGGVWNKYDPGRLMEFHTLPPHRRHALPMYRALIDVSGATEAEAQSNMPLMSLMLFDCAQGIRAENVLFADGFESSLPSPGGVFRESTAEERQADPDLGDWVVDLDGEILANGGVLFHYNPPYGDIYMWVAEHARQQGYGSYIVQELKRTCREMGKTPAARCNAANEKSRRTLQKAGMLPCGRLLVGSVKSNGEGLRSRVAD